VAAGRRMNHGKPATVGPKATPKITTKGLPWGNGVVPLWWNGSRDVERVHFCVANLIPWDRCADRARSILVDRFGCRGCDQFDDGEAAGQRLAAHVCVIWQNSRALSCSTSTFGGK